METNESLTDATKARLQWADDVEALARNILTALGFQCVASMSAADIVARLTGWLALLGLVKRDAQGRFGSVWWSAYQEHLKRSGYIDLDAAHREATSGADMAADAFARRFPPLAEEIEEPVRDTETDLDALRQELAEREEALAAAIVRIEILERAASAVPIPKPDNVTPGQRWAYIDTTEACADGDETMVYMVDYQHEIKRGYMLSSDKWTYFGKAS